jgi:hypothetical protein
VNTRACFRILAVCDLKPLRAAEDELERAELEKCEMVPDTARNCLLFGQEWTFADVRVHVRFAPEKGTFLNAVLMSALCHFRTSRDFIDRHFARDALERRPLRARGDAGILQQRRRLRIVDDRLAGEDRV